jgi:two-component system chemotaxis response regulator CheB
MPASALANVQVDHVVTVRDLGPLLTRLVRERVGVSGTETDAELTAFEKSKAGEAPLPVCPLCHGTLTAKALEGFTVFRCHVGHAFTTASLLDEQTQEVERALWAAVRSLEEGAAVARRVAEHSHGVLKDRMDERAASQRRQAELIRGLLLQPFAPER